MKLDPIQQGALRRHLLGEATGLDRIIVGKLLCELDELEAERKPQPPYLPGVVE